MIRLIRRPLLLSALALLTIPAANLRADDAADARKTVESFLISLQAGDEKAVHAAITIPPEQNTAVTTLLDCRIATSKLQKTALAKFGPAANPFGPAAGAFDARLKAIQEASVKSAGSSLILTIPEDPATKQKPWTLILTKSPAGWKIDAASMYNLSPENQAATDKHVALSAKLIPITNQMIQEINDNKYPAAVDAYQEFWSRTIQADKDLHPTTAPTTAPTTTPAK